MEQAIRKKDRNILRDLYALFLGLLPWIMIYKFPFGNFSIVVLLSFLFLPYVLLSLTRKQSKVLSFRALFILIFFLYYGYSLSNDFKTMVLLAIVAIHVIAAPKSLNFDKFVSVVQTFALVSSIAIILQVLLYTLTGYMFPLIWNDMVSEVYKETTGFVVESKNFVRFSGFFFEPSAYSKYALVGLSFLLFDGAINRKKIKKAVAITLGIVASTSSMGIIGAVGFWSYYIIVKDNYVFKNKSKIAKIVYLCILGTIILGALFTVSHGFQQSVLRVIGASSDNYDAINGRTGYSEIYLTQLSGSSFLYGLNYMEFDNYVVGYVKIMMFSGLIGLILLIFSCIACLLKNRPAVKINIIVYIVLLFFAEIVGAMSLLFYFVMFNCCNSCNNEKNRFSAYLRA